MGRNWKRFCLVGLALVGLSCDKSPTALRPRPAAPDKNIDVSTGTLSLTLQFGGASFSSLQMSASWNCSTQLWMDAAPPSNPNGTFIHYICFTDLSAASISVPDLPPGAHTFQLRDGAQNGYLLGEAQATLVAGESTPLTLDVAQNASLVRGTLHDNGAVPAAFQYVVCGAPNDCSYVSSSDGTFAFVAVPGSHTATVHGANAYTTLGSFAYSLTAGQTSDLGEFPIQSGKLDLQLRLGNAALASLTASPSQSCPFRLYIDPTPTNLQGEFARYLCGGEVTLSSVVVGPLPVGTHTFQLLYSSGAVVASNTNTISAGGTTSQAFELGGAMGLVTGKLTANGAPPTEDNQYVVCSFTNDCYFAAKSTGNFTYVELAGQHTETLRKPNASAGVTIDVAVTAGHTTDVGTVSADAGSASVDIRFGGESISGKLSQSQSPFYIYRDPTSSNPTGQYVRYVYTSELSNPAFSLEGLPVGSHTFQLREIRSNSVLATTTIDLTSGQQSSLVFDVTSNVGLISGTLRVNGAVPSPYAYLICPASQGCYYVTDPNGVFSYVDFPGARTATVRGANTNVDISDFGYSVSAGQTTIVGTTTGGASGNTATGTNVTIKPFDSNTGTQTVTLMFSNVTGSGQTTVSQNPNGPPPPHGQQGGNPIWYYYIATSATFVGDVEVCINYDPTQFKNTNNLALQHYNETTSRWENVTVPQDTRPNVICGKVTSFSPFLITEPSNVAPVASASATPLTANEGQNVAFDGTRSADPNGDALLYAWDFGDGSHGTGSTTTHAYADNGTYNATLTVTEDGAEGLSNSSTVTVTVRNVAPTAQFVAPATVVEGSSFSLTMRNPQDASATDFESGLTIEFDCGAGFGPSGNCGVAVDGPGSRTVRGRITDKDHDATIYTATVSVLNANPVVAPLSAASIVSGQTLSLAGSFSDAGAIDGPWSATIDWNDGSPFSTLSVSQQGAVGDSHRFTKPGVYAVRLTVADKDGGMASQVMGLTVSPLSVSIDVQPGKSPNSISLKKPTATIPVVILSTRDFDATTIDPATITIGDENGIDTPVARSSTGALVVNSPLDMNGDGRLDLMVHFTTSELQANGDLSTVAGTTQTLVLKGKTKSPDGRFVRGTDQIAVTP